MENSSKVDLKLLIEDSDGNENIYILYDKIPFNKKNIIIYLFEEEHGSINLMFLNYDLNSNILSEEIESFDEMLFFYNSLTSKEEL